MLPTPPKNISNRCLFLDGRTAGPRGCLFFGVCLFFWNRIFPLFSFSLKKKKKGFFGGLLIHGCRPKRARGLLIFFGVLREGGCLFFLGFFFMCVRVFKPRKICANLHCFNEEFSYVIRYSMNWKHPHIKRTNNTIWYSPPTGRLLSCPPVGTIRHLWAGLWRELFFFLKMLQNVFEKCVQNAREKSCFTFLCFFLSFFCPVVYRLAPSPFFKP